MKHMETETILNELDQLYPNAHCELHHRNAYEMAVAVILSAQTTDASVNRVTPILFEHFPDLASLASGKIGDIEKDISSLGLYHNKARAIQGFASGVIHDFDGQIPATIEKLIQLPGVGRKCANVIQSECFGLPSLAVDTHVSRVSKRLGLAFQKDDPSTIERKLKHKIPRERWTKTHHQMIFFGRYLCHAQRPECSRCPFTEICHEKNKNL